ncbi:MAG: CaiB/BaiF CoA transferase family protein [Acidimicrobiia bacterium]
MGPLSGCRVVEFAGLAPAPYAAMLLADLGAEVVRIDRPGTGPGNPIVNRSRLANITVDLKDESARNAVLALIDEADVLIEPFRPGVMERLGLGPEVLLARNPKLVFARLTGWGQEGPLANRAGHDVNYLAVSGTLRHLVWRSQPVPYPPLNLLADFAGGGLFTAFGIVSALYEAQRSGQGQVVDGAMIDGSASLISYIRGMRVQGRASNIPGESFLDGAIHHYNVYETADGHYLSVGPIERQFQAIFAEKLGLNIDDLPGQYDIPQDDVIDNVRTIIKTKTRDEWAAIFEGTDACVFPVLSMDEAATHSHNVARGTFVEVNGIVQHAPGPRFSRTQPDLPTPVKTAGEGVADLVERWGIGAEHANALGA